jgi:hypothetical protein
MTRILVLADFKILTLARRGSSLKQYEGCERPSCDSLRRSCATIERRSRDFGIPFAAERLSRSSVAHSERQATAELQHGWRITRAVWTSVRLYWGALAAPPVLDAIDAESRHTEESFPDPARRKLVGAYGIATVSDGGPDEPHDCQPPSTRLESVAPLPAY